jgi:TPR repeat protein
MARFDIQNASDATMGGENRADVFCEMGLMYATGRGCDVDLIAMPRSRVASSAAR